MKDWCGKSLVLRGIRRFFWYTTCFTTMEPTRR